MLAWVALASDPNFAEGAQDAVGGIMVNSANVGVSYDDAAPNISWYLIFANSGGDWGTAATPARSDHLHDSRYSLLGHTHAAADIVSGTVATARLGSGTASVSNWLRGDQTWATPTKADVGLSNVDNTSDATKNAAVATLTNKTLTSPVITTPTGLVKGDVGLGNVDNTSDATKNSAVATLTNKTLTTPTIGDLTNAQHGHTTAAGGGTLSASAIATGTMATARLGSGTASLSNWLRGDQTWTAPTKADVGLNNVDNTSDATKNSAVATLTNKTLTSPVITTPTGLVKGDVGLGNVDNTSDATKNSAAVTLTNKTIDNTNAITLKDSSFTLQNATTTTKQFKFDLSALSAATTRTATVPDKSGTLAMTSDLPSIASTTSVVKGNGSGGIVAATANTDYLPATTGSALQRASGGGLTAAVAGTDYTSPTGTESLSNKTLGNTNTLTLKVTLFTLQDPTDTTKQFQLVLSGLTTATTRSWTVPDVNDTFVGLTASQTLTNKTLTTPTIGSFVNAAHNHQSAAGGGTLDAAAVTTGIFGTGRLGSGTANSGVFLRGDGTWAAPAGGGDTSSNTAVSVVGEFALFADTTGKLLKRGTGTGIVTAASGVMGTIAQPTGTVVGTSDTQTLTNKTLTSPAITSPTGLVKGDVGLGNVDNTSDATKNSAVATLSNKTNDNTNVYTTKANNFTLQDPTTTTKQAQFGLANIPAATTRIYNLPEYGVTGPTLMVDHDQTFQLLDDDFASGGTTDGNIGEIGWNLATGGSGSFSYVTQSNNLRAAGLATGGTSGGKTGLFFGPFDIGTNILLKQLEYYFQVNSATSACQIYLGLSDVQNGTPSNGLVLRFDSGLDTQWTMVKYTAGGTASSVFTSRVPTVNRIYKFTMKANGSNYDCTLNDSTSGSITIASMTPPVTTSNYYLYAFITTTNGTGKQLYLDYFRAIYSTTRNL